jgi:hypothetical protein
MQPPQFTRDVHRLTGRLGALDRFILLSEEQILPFLRTLRGAKVFVWGLE